ncbi:cyclic nucleotide-binding/CBS domain-containing protein [Natronoarchaeum sp. GCM10025703]|uniref:CBS domain-containing protein n=1 Tax=unclassified Natronoarchaeum TaxID=2620183 RepID=UPI003612EA52
MATQEQPLVKDVMSRPLITIPAEMSLVDAAEKMREHDISALLVTTAPPSLITSTDILNAIAQGKSPSEVVVGDVMTESVESIPPDLRLQQTAAMMETFQISHLPVIDDDYIGMVSSTDLTNAFW